LFGRLVGNGSLEEGWRSPRLYCESNTIPVELPGKGLGEKIGGGNDGLSSLNSLLSKKEKKVYKVCRKKNLNFTFGFD